MAESPPREDDSEGGQEGGVRERLPWKRRLLDVVFPLLTLPKGEEKEELGRRKSVFILSILYFSHIFSSWGDRMWQFLVALLLASLFPGSLLLPAVFGLVQGLMVAMFGTFVGDWVDFNPRMRVATLSLLLQNGLLVMCAVALSVMFGLDLGYCSGVSLPLFILLTVFIIFLGSAANVATVANTIAIEKDWIVVIANKNGDTLAALNANMRRIDLLCKVLAPAVAGVILQYTGPLTTTIVVALWNVVSFFVELGLLRVVFYLVPTLAVKKLRKKVVKFLQNIAEELVGEEEEEEGGVKTQERETEKEDDETGERKEEVEEEGDGGEEEEEGGKEVESARLVKHTNETHHARTLRTLRRRSSVLAAQAFGHLASPYTSLRNGWRTYIRQEVAIAGIALATIYLTVLGFSGVTSAYFLTQGLRTDVIGAAMALGAVCGIAGTFAYPFVRGWVGTVRSGMIGILVQLFMLLFCAVAVLIPADHVNNPAESYYAPSCPSNQETPNLTSSICTITTPTSLLAMPTSLLAMPTSLLAMPTSLLAMPTSLLVTPTNIPSLLYPSVMISPSSTLSPTSHPHTSHLTSPPHTPTPSPIVQTAMASPQTTMASIGSGHGLSSGGSGLLEFDFFREEREVEEGEKEGQREEGEKREEEEREEEYSSLPLPSPTCVTLSHSSSSLEERGKENGGVRRGEGGGGGVRGGGREERGESGGGSRGGGGRVHNALPLSLILLGVIGARGGLWMFDLAVQQLVQETVPEEERGVVGGVLNAMNSMMDLLHYVLVIAAPRPEHFRILVLISVAMVMLGAALYAAHVCRVLGRSRCCGRGLWVGGHRGFSPVVCPSAEEDRKCLVNAIAEDEM